MPLIMNDVEIIREVRRLCLQHQFQNAIDRAHEIEDIETRQTLLSICNSFFKISTQQQNYLTATL